MSRSADTYLLEMTVPGGWYTGEHATPVTDTEQVYALERLFQEDDGHVSDGLRHALESRLVTHEEDGRGKVVSVECDGKAYELSRDETGDGWNVKVLVNGVELGTGIIDRCEWLDAEVSSDELHPRLHDGAFLEAIWNQDIPDSLRAALHESAKVEHDEFTKLCVEHGGRTYKFYHDPAQEYGEWAMDVYAGDDNNREPIRCTEICEPSDVEYLNKLFKEKVG